ncbi:MAG: DEAD/DEAH box helicase [Solirubrobacteraceae bacterium]
MTFSAREFSQRRVGSVRRDDRFGQPSAVMDLGEAVQTAVQRGLPLLLSTEAAGHLADTVRVGRMKGRPGALTITTSDGLSASTRRVVAEQAIPELRALKASGARVTLDAGARQVVRMTQARPLADDPVLLGRQQEIAALKVVGSGVDAGQVGTGKSVTTGRALSQRAATTRRLRAMIIAEGRLLGQWRDELTLGAPGRGLPPLAPNVEVLVLDDRRPAAGQIRAFDTAVADRAGVVLVPNGVLDRHPADLQVIPWHLLIADEALRYANPATDAHQALKLVRFGAVADCWLLTATPRGKSAEHLDVLVGLAVGDDAMITERLATREAGDLMDELNAHRLRVNYGPHLVRVTRQDMHAWMPEVRPAQPLAIAPDPALQELLDAIRQGGRDAYHRLIEVLRELKTLEAGTGLFRQALAELSRAQGVVLGNVGVYVDASVDPETLTHSQATLAKALHRQGLVAEAMRGGGDGLPLLRGITAQTIAGVAAEEQVIVFAERVSCLRQLARTLTNRHDVHAHVADGQITPHEFETLKHRFTAGEFPVLCLSRIGAEGHNLQNASCIVHLDLPWLPSGLEQRVGRAARPGAARAWVQTYIPYIRGAGVEHIVSILSPRGAEHHAVLDSFEGVAANQSTIATQLGAITGQVADAKDQAGFQATAARLRVAASVFGA